jgi:Zn-dependent protease
MFWLLSAILGFQLLNDPGNAIAKFGIWMVCVFISILVHEMGHVLMGRLFGTSGRIVLYAFGGLAIPDRRLYNRWQRIAVSFAGPLAQFLLVGFLLALAAVSNRQLMVLIVDFLRSLIGLHPLGDGITDVPELVENAVYMLLYINIFWAILNLLPIWPLDGGQICRDFLDGVMPRGQGVRAALRISLVLAAILTIHSIASANHVRIIPFLPFIGGIYSALLFGSLAVQSWQLLQREVNPPWRREDW